MDLPDPARGHEATLASLSFEEVRDALAAGRLSVRTGPLITQLRSGLPDVAHYVRQAYRHHPASIDAPFSDFHLTVRVPRNLRRWLRPQVEFSLDGDVPFEPLPRDQAPAVLEWGLNWAIASSCHQWLGVHAACIEREGAAVILPAPPGSGKSTLCAALVLRGWRLLSDELTLIDTATLQVQALARPVNLKNASIELIRSFEPSTEWGPQVFDTVKGRVTHLCPPRSSVARMNETAMPRWVVFPRFEAGAQPTLTPRRKAATFTQLGENAFNYGVLGELGFEVIGRVLDLCDCYDFTYSRLEDALEVFESLAQELGTADRPA